MSAWKFISWSFEDFYADTADLDATAQAVYMALLATAWERPDAALANDMEWLKRAIIRRIAKFHGHTFNRVVPGLLERFFVLGKDGCWRNKRVTNERQIADKRSANQKTKAAKRWGKWSDHKDLADAVASAAAMPLQLQQQERKKEREAIASPKKERPPAIKKKAVPFPETFQPNEADVEAFIAVGFGDLERELAAFRDYHVAKGSVFVDWHAAFRTWLRSPYRKPAMIGGGHGRQRTVVDVAREDVARMEARDRALAEQQRLLGHGGGPGGAGDLGAIPQNGSGRSGDFLRLIESSSAALPGGGREGRLRSS